MEPNTQNSSGMMNGIPPVAKQDKKVGPIIGVLVIVLVLIIGALWFFGQRLNTSPSAQKANVESSASASTANDAAGIKADLDAQMKDIDYSF